MLQQIKKLTTIDLFDKRHHLWGGPDHFAQRTIKMDYSTSRDIHHVFDNVLRELKASKEDRVVFFCTTVADCSKVREKFEAYLNKHDCKVDVVVIHGQLEKQDKFRCELKVNNHKISLQRRL